MRLTELFETYGSTMLYNTVGLTGMYEMSNSDVNIKERRMQCERDALNKLEMSNIHERAVALNKNREMTSNGGGDVLRQLGREIQIASKQFL